MVREELRGFSASVAEGARIFMIGTSHGAALAKLGYHAVADDRGMTR